MEFTYENTVKWFDDYYKAFNKNAGPLETVPNMQKYFAPDLEFWAYTFGEVAQMSREGLLMSMVHPGLHEELTPQYYVVDVKQMIVVVQFQFQVTDEPSGKELAAGQASCHYHLALDENKDLKIKKILYWVQTIPPDKYSLMLEVWGKYRDKALMELANSWIKAKS